MNDPSIPFKPPLPGTSIDGKWKVGDSSGALSEDLAPLAIFPLVKPKADHFEISGTGFFFSTNGAFVTAKHVAEEAYNKDGTLADMRIVQFLPSCQWMLRPIGRFLMHHVADIAIGMPLQILDHRAGPTEYRGKVLTMGAALQGMQQPISTLGVSLAWGLPR
jgi:hypothetical protein